MCTAPIAWIFIANFNQLNTYKFCHTSLLWWDQNMADVAAWQRNIAINIRQIWVKYLMKMWPTFLSIIYSHCKKGWEDNLAIHMRTVSDIINRYFVNFPQSQVVLRTSEETHVGHKDGEREEEEWKIRVCFILWL